ncbi:uncharacterized protein TNCV_863341 [Trichonephila clavipes]|nr:uncharacterized protein TNCV_863341 [Trichonephila clavipes]
MKGNSFFPLETTTEVNRDESQFALSVNAESFVPKVDKTQIVATACFKNKCFLSTALILVKDKYSEWQTFRALLLDSGSETCLISNECANKLQLKTERINTLISCLNDASMVVNGCVKVAISNQNKSSERELDMLVVHCGLIRDEDLNKTSEKFWKVEEVEEPIVKNKERLICEEHYANTHFRTKDGKYVVSNPLKKEPSCLSNSKDKALKRLGSLWNRLATDENYLNLYREFLRDYERLGHMKEVTNETEPEITLRYPSWNLSSRKVHNKT